MDTVRTIIAGINNSLQGVFKGGIFYGVAELVDREGRTQPVVNEQPVGFDDSYAMQMYHRLGNVAISTKPGFGDNDQTINTYTVTGIVFNNKRITRLNTDEMALIIQSVLATNNNATLTGIILNSQQVFATEYRGTPYALDEYRSLMQINYTVEIDYNANCFNVCPEDINCST